mgnify:CR=1 FL=1
MNIQRFTAPTSREALAKARLAFGEGTLILSNRTTASGIEVVATGEDTLAALDKSELTNREKIPTQQKRAPIHPVDTRATVEEDVAQLSMSTLSFQDYVRERMLRRRAEALAGPSEPLNRPETPSRPAKIETRQVPGPVEFRPAAKQAPQRTSLPTRISPSSRPCLPLPCLKGLLTNFMP